MTLLAWPAMLLLSAAAILIALAAWRQGPKHREVGTLLIWRRVADQHVARQERRRSFDLLLWTLLAGVIVGGIAATRPAWMVHAGVMRVAVYVEPTGPGNQQLDMDEVRQRAEDFALSSVARGSGELDADIELTFFLPSDGLAQQADVRRLQPGPLRAELAQFDVATAKFDGRILFLNARLSPVGLEDLLLPRVLQRRHGVLLSVSGGRESVTVKSLGEPAPWVSGATLISTTSVAGPLTSAYRPNSAQFEVRDVSGTRAFRRRPLLIGTGGGWSGDAHVALLDALQPDSADGRPPDVWLGSDEQMPAVRVSAGDSADLSKAELAFDPQHPLFRDLPLADFQWLAEGKLMAPADNVQSLLTAVVDGEPVGDLVRLRDGGKVLEFAGDPFTRAPVASAALLLDNAIGVVSGVRPSEWQGFEQVEGPGLLTERQAQADYFDPRGSLDMASRSSEPLEFSTWLCVAAGLLLLVAAAIAAQSKNPRPKPGAVVRSIG
ncbi:MAG: hypothetical protein KDB90_00645 [Planctomycetes bacterium]|nr:hypothetical protein [Planctomycetota bacterium]